MDLADEDGEREGMAVPGTSVYHRFDQRTRHGGVSLTRVLRALLAPCCLS